MTEIRKPKYKNELVDTDYRNVRIVDDPEIMRVLLARRASQFFHQLTGVVKGTPVDAFGPRGNGVWGQDDDIHSFSIKGIAFEFADVFQNPRKTAKYQRENPEVYSVVRVALDKYNANKDGLIYTDETFLKQIRKVVDDLGFKGDIDYTEQGMQGKTFVSMSLVFPMDVIAPDLNYFLVNKWSKEHNEEQRAKREERKRNKMSL